MVDKISSAAFRTRPSPVPATLGCTRKHHHAVVTHTQEYQGYESVIAVNGKHPTRICRLVNNYLKYSNRREPTHGDMS